MGSIAPPSGGGNVVAPKTARKHDPHDDDALIPAEMKALPQWVVWRMAIAARSGKPTKVPFQSLRPREKAKTDDPSTWSTFEEAKAAASDPRNGLNGFGFVFSDGDPFAGIDFDNCLDESGSVMEWGRPYIDRTVGYAEVSPSGRGVKVFTRGQVPGGKGHKKQKLGPDGKGVIEIYDRTRFFTVTGRVFENRVAIGNGAAELADLHAELFPPEKPQDRPRIAPTAPPSLDDAGIIAKARESKDGALFSSLFGGSIEGYPSKSEADLALCNLLAFWTGGDLDAIDRLFRQSGLCDQKWTGRADYREKTIGKSLKGRVDFYDPGYGRRNGVKVVGLFGAPEGTNGHHQANGHADIPPGGDRATGKQPDDEPGEGEDVVDRWPKMDEAAFHGIAGEIVRTSMPHTEADPVAVLVQFLVGFANAVGRGPHWIAGATHHYLVMFAALVGPTSSGRKGSSWDIVKYFLKSLDRTWAKDRITRGLTSGEGLIYHVRDKVSKFNDDGEEEVVDEGVKDKRLFSIESELGRTLKVMGRESNTLSAVMRQAWDCDDQLSTLTKNSTNIASNPHISVVGHITCDELEALLKGTESANGFGNRFLWVCVRRSKELPEGGAFYGHDWSPIIGRLSRIFDAAKEVPLMTRDAEARRIWHGVYPDLSCGKPGLLGSMLARAEAQVMRLACIYALLDESRRVESPHMLAALAVWEYAEASARFIFGDALADPRAEKLLDALKASPDGMNRTEISSKVFGRNLQAPLLTKLLERLLTLDLIHRVGPKKGERWFAGRAPRVPQ